MITWLWEIIGGAYFITGVFALFNMHLIGLVLCIAGLGIATLANNEEMKQ